MKKGLVFKSITYMQVLNISKKSDIKNLSKKRKVIKIFFLK